METESIGQILLQQTELATEQLDLALRIQQTRRPRPDLGDILIEKEYISPMQLCKALANQWNIPFLEKISPDQIDKNLVRKISPELLKKHRLLPIIDKNEQLAIAMVNPLNVEAIDAVQNIAGIFARRVLAPTGEIEQAISQCFYAESHNQIKADQDECQNSQAAKTPDSDAEKVSREDLLDVANLPPVVKLVNTILFQAVNNRASDIHIEPYEDVAKVRYRIDGVLHEANTLNINMVPSLISRLKIMANLNIAEKRLPQDGQCRIKIGDNELDVRVSSIPASGGERIVLRLLDKGGANITIDKLGLDPDIRSQLVSLANNTHGVILLTGPTGSGKTTTLYCILNELNTHERNILTVEDPIEYQLPGIGQMQVKPKIDLNFASCLRHILRQDPDVIMIGEIRDHETAEIAIHASLTGHLVLSTLHTNDSASAVTRLADMGIEPYLISSALIAVMAQRLLRKICPECKVSCQTEYDLYNIVKPHLDLSPVNPKFYIGGGCEHCNSTGYVGRAAISELLIIDEAVKELITKNTPAHEIKNLARKNGMLTLRDDGLRQALCGITTVEEILRVTQENVSSGIGITEHGKL